MVYSFAGQDDRGRTEGALIEDTAGNLYGSSALDGSGGGGTGLELSPSDGGWTYNLVHSFSGSVGPVAAFTMDPSGNLYGTTYKWFGRLRCRNDFNCSTATNGRSVKAIEMRFRECSGALAPQHQLEALQPLCDTDKRQNKATDTRLALAIDRPKSIPD